MLVQHYPIIGSSSRICWQVTMCARVDTDKENQDKNKGKHTITIHFVDSELNDPIWHSLEWQIGSFSSEATIYSLMTRIICHVYHTEYTWTEIFCWYKACYCYCWFTWSERFCHRISLFNAEIIHATKAYCHWGGEYFCIVSRYICRKVSRSACDQCKVMLMPIINCIHFCLRSTIWIFRLWGFCSTSKLNRIGSNERIFGNIPEQIQHMSHKRDPITTFIKDTKSHASCECFRGLILHKGLFCPHSATPCTVGKQWTHYYQ